MMKQKLILLVDDNFGDRNLVQLALIESRSETRLVVATDGDEAIAYLFREGIHAKAPKPDLVILDWNLSRRNGGEVLRAIKSDPTLTHLPVIIFTGGSFVPEMASVCDGKFVFNVLKPDKVDAFFRAINEIDDFVKTAIIPPILNSQVAA